MSVRPERDRVIVGVSGEIDIATVGDLDDVVRELRSARWPEIVLDVRGVELVGSTGLAWMLSTLRSARTDGWTLVLVDGSPAVTRLLELTRTYDLFRWTKGV